jgi:ATP synthase protein I
MSDEDNEFAQRIANRTALKLKAQRAGAQTTWFGLGMSGIVGWSVALPTLLGGGLGLWWDKRHPGPHSWTLALLVAGLTLGCANAWHWISRQNKSMDHAAGGSDD